MPTKNELQMWSLCPDSYKASSFEKKASLLDTKQADDKGPPNYRPGDPASSCYRCDEFDNVNTCTKYAAQVNSSYTCDSFEPKNLNMDSKLTQLAKPVEPEEPLKPGQAFKFGFLLKCAELGFTTDQVTELLEKQSWLPALALGAGSMMQGLGTAAGALPGLAAAAMVPAVGLPALAGISMAHAHHMTQKDQQRKWTDANKIDVDDLKNIQLMQAYNQHSKDITMKKELADAAAAVPTHRAPRGPKSQTFGSADFEPAV